MVTSMLDVRWYCLEDYFGKEGAMDAVDMGREPQFKVDDRVSFTRGDRKGSVVGIIQKVGDYNPVFADRPYQVTILDGAVPTVWESACQLRAPAADSLSEDWEGHACLVKFQQVIEEAHTIRRWLEDRQKAFASSTPFIKSCPPA